MNPENENFEQLRRALSLKRYEVPPPGYFNNFSSQVIARIKAGEQGNSQESWFGRIRAIFEGKPILAGAFGAAACALLVAGVLGSEETGTSTSISIPALASQSAPPGGNSTPLVAFSQSQPADTVQLTSSTNPVTGSLNSLFDQFQPKVERVNSPVPAGF